MIERIKTWWRARVSLREKKRFLQLCKRFDAAQLELTAIDTQLLNRARLSPMTHFVAPKFCVSPENKVGLCVCRFDACDLLGLSPCMYCDSLRYLRCFN